MSNLVRVAKLQGLSYRSIEPLAHGRELGGEEVLDGVVACQSERQITRKKSGGSGYKRLSDATSSNDSNIHEMRNHLLWWRMTFLVPATTKTEFR